MVALAKEIWDRFRLTIPGKALNRMLLCAIIPGMAMTLLLMNSNLKRLGSILLVHQATDSWIPIGNALNYVGSHPDATGLYQATYFAQESQFMYAPQGLALIDVLARYLHFSFGDLQQAKIASWWLLPIMALISYAIVLKTEVWQRASKPDLADKAILLGIAFAGTYLMFPITNGYSVGNIQNFLTAFVALSLLMFLKQRNFLAGVLFAIAVLVKPQIGIFIVWAALRRNFAFCGGVLAGCGAASLLSLWLYGWGVHFEFLNFMRFLSDRGESFYASHSIESTIYRMLHEGNNLWWDPTHKTLKPIAWVHWLATALGLGVLAVAFKPRPKSYPEVAVLDFGMAYMAIIMASPVSYEHHFGLVYVVFPTAFLIAYRQFPQDGVLLGLLSASFVCLANMLPVTDWLAETPFNFLQSYRLIGTALLLVAIIRMRSKLVANYNSEPSGGRQNASEIKTPGIALEA